MEKLTEQATLVIIHQYKVTRGGCFQSNSLKIGENATMHTKTMQLNYVQSPCQWQLQEPQKNQSTD